MDRIQFLWQQYIRKKASRQEIDELFLFIADPANEVFFNKILEDQAAHQDPLPDFNPSSLQWLLDEALIRARESEKTEIITPCVHFIRRTWVRYAAAAASILIISSGLYFYFNRQRSTAPALAGTNRQLSTDIVPGTSKAMLTLANGSVITLDSAHAGLLAKQNGSDIMKSDSGMLAYENSHTPILPYSRTTYNTLTTPRGGQYQLVLPDGTKVWLNAASSITYPTSFSGDERKVTVSGEAYFEVKHSAKMPFRVKVGDQAIEDIGTHFNINAYNDHNDEEVATTLLEGSVKISLLRPAEHGTNYQLRTILTPGEQARTTSGTNKISVRKIDDLEDIVAWKNGKMAFDHGDIKKFMQDISRWYDVDVEFSGKIPEGSFSGSLNRNASLSSILKALNAFGVQTRIEGKKIIVQ